MYGCIFPRISSYLCRLIRCNMIMTEDRHILKKSVRIPCAECVHEYTMATLQRLGNLRCTDVYRSMKSSGGITLQSYSKALHDIDKLLTCADSFMPSVPMTAKDVDDSRQFIVTWKRHLLQMRKQLACTCKPVYLQDEVTRVLRERKSKVKFHSVMLEWYLSRYGADNLTPEKIADAVLEHEGTDWRKVKPLAKGKKAFNIRLDADTKAEKDLALKYIQWIFKLETKDVSPTLLADIKNDLAVVKEFEAWRDGEPENYEYKNTYHQFISRLRPAPSSEVPMQSSPATSVTPATDDSPAGDSLDSVPDGGHIPPSVQSSIQNTRLCPIHHRPLHRRMNSKTGEYFWSCSHRENGVFCDYTESD